MDKPHEVIGERETDSPSLRVSPQPGLGGMGGDGYDQSNSEDSSLSDSDRTLIGDAPGKFSFVAFNNYVYIEFKLITIK